MTCNWDRTMHFSLSPSWLIHLGLNQHKKQKIQHGCFNKEEGGCNLAPMAMLLISFGNANNAGPSKAGTGLFSPMQAQKPPTFHTRDNNNT